MTTTAVPATRERRPGAADEAPPGTAERPARARRPRPATVQRREDILQAAMATFGARGYHHGSLAEVAERVGMTHVGVLHHFGSKDQLLLEVLAYRDRAGVEQLEGGHTPRGTRLFDHLVQTARLNATRPGIVQTYAVLSAEAVTDDHPGRDWFRNRYVALRRLVAEALVEICAEDDPPDPATLDSAAASVLAVMDGLQVQWLLDREAVDLGGTTAFAIEAILQAAVAGRDRRHL